ncbi:MAG: NAD(+) synthase [Desulfarculaceae bacterium]|nr:NAD(+) synthase [Desulfarculaceae bacterium]
MLDISTDYDLMIDNIKRSLAGYLTANPALKSLVVGLSGGIDSALTCILAAETLTDIPDVRLIGRSLPIETNTDEETARGKTIGRLFSDSYETRDLSTAYQNLYRELVPEARAEDDSFNEKIRRGNIKARVRMIYLFDLAHANSGMVLSTDNLTELLLGFWTLHGDVGNYGLIQNLWKTEVYGLAAHLEDRFRQSGRTEKADALNASIDAVPTDGLGITSSDFDQLEVTTYQKADRLLTAHLKDPAAYPDHPVIRRYHATRFKRNDPANIQREDLLAPLSNDSLNKKTGSAGAGA